MPFQPFLDTVPTGDDGGPSSETTSSPSVNIDVSETSGGASANQDTKNIEEFAAEGGGVLAIVYGEHLIAGTLVAKKFIAGTPNQLYAIIALGDANGNGGGHGEWDKGVINVWYSGDPLTAAATTSIYVEDAVPGGASAVADTDGWNWVSLNPYPYSGTLSHQSALLSGTHQHYFQNATTTMSVVTGDWLFTFIYIDPDNPPREVMLQWQDAGGGFEHRAYWGENLIAFGTDGTNSRRFVGPLPPFGQWCCLGVRASDVGLEGVTVKGMAYALYDGRATWDYSGKINWATTTGYHFHPGLISTGLYDGFQGVDPYLSAGIAYSGTAYIAVRVPDGYANAEDRPDKLRGRYKGRKVNTYDAYGNLIGNAYSTNPAYVALDRILAYYEKRHATDLKTGRAKFRKRINWEKWYTWAANCAGLIPWDRDGTGSPSNFLRFEAQCAFTGDLILADALDAICATSGAFWQDDGEQINFLPPVGRDPVHHLHPGNILSAPRIEARDLREQPNRFVVEFRDYDDPYLGLSTIEVKRDALIKQVGEIKTVRSLPTMHQSQAQRVAERWARIECDNPIFVSLIADESAIHVLPGDELTMTHALGNWEYQRFLVVATVLSSAEEGPDAVEMVLQQIDGPLYSDTAHTPRQAPLTP